MQQTLKPLVGIICDVFGRDHKADRPFHGVAEEYIRAVQQGADCTPLLIPACFASQADSAALCERLDGILLTGSRTNVHPDHYAGPASKPDTLHDLQRDAASFPLIQCAIASKTPLMGICRGFQEINAALGGSLHQQITACDKHIDHARNFSLPEGQQYQAAHSLTLTKDGYLQQLLGHREIQVNSLHHQGIDRLAETLVVEAVAEDGIIEAVRLADDEHFFVAVQWHPEWEFDTDPVSRALFGAFKDAVYRHAKTA